MDGKKKLLIVALSLAVFIAILLIVINSGKRSSSGGGSVAAPPPPPAGVSETSKQSLGAKLFDQAKNPIQDKLPDLNPVENSNPIRGLYTNPFQ